MLKFWFGLFAKQGSVLLIRKVEQAADIFLANASLGGKHTGNALWRNADDRVGRLLGQFQLMQGHDDGHILLVGQRLVNSHQLSLAFYIQKDVGSSSSKISGCWQTARPAILAGADRR